MEDNFNVRVDRAFGSLEAIKSTSSLSSLWCLTDQEIERNEWIKDKITPYSFKHKDEVKNPKSFLLGQPSSTCHQDLESEEEEEEESKPDDHSNEEWNIRSSVGMDCTLDNEEEEDGFDKVALGKEEGFYMREVNDYQVELDSISNTELPNSFTHVMRDPRANRMAAKLRLKQDDDDESIQRQTSVVPDYVRNPSKYTHYTFDIMDDVDEESNKKAYMELFKNHHVSNDSPTSIVFTPKNKSNHDDSMNQNMQQHKKKKKKKAVPFISIAEAEAEADVCVMEEDEPVTEMPTNKGKGGRRYRTKASGGDLE